MTRFAFVDREKALYAVSVLCRLLKVSTSGYYAWASRPPSKRDVADGVLTTQIQNAFDANRKVYGSPRIHAELADADVHVGRKRVARLMRKAGIVGCHRRKHKLGSTKQNPAAAPAPDLVDRKFTATAPNQLWVADVQCRRRHCRSYADLRTMPTFPTTVEVIRGARAWKVGIVAAA